MAYWDPFEEIEKMGKMAQRAMHEFLSPMREEFLEGSFPVDVSESKDENELIVKAALPGFGKEEVAVKVTENTIEIEAQHKEKKIEQTEKMYRVEKRFGTLRKLLTLPAEVKPESAKANMENGILEIKLEKVQPKKKAKEVKVK